MPFGGVLLKNNPVSRVTVYSFMTPVMGVLLSNLLLTEQNGVSAVNLVVTLVFVCAGILILNYKRRDGTGGADFAGLRRRRLLGRGQKRARRTENPQGGKFFAASLVL